MSRTWDARPLKFWEHLGKVSLMLYQIAGGWRWSTWAQIQNLLQLLENVFVHCTNRKVIHSWWLFLHRSQWNKQLSVIATGIRNLFHFDVIKKRKKTHPDFMFWSLFESLRYKIQWKIVRINSEVIAKMNLIPKNCSSANNCELHFYFILILFIIVKNHRLNWS